MYLKRGGGPLESLLDGLEGVLQASLSPVGVDLVSNHAEFAIDGQRGGHRHGATSFAGELGFGFATIRREEGRTTLNVDTQLVKGLFSTNMEVGGSARIIRASKTAVGLHVDVGTSKGRGSSSNDQSGSDNGFHVEIGFTFSFWTLPCRQLGAS